MIKKGWLITSSLLLISALLISTVVGCAQTAPAPAPGPAPTVTVTATPAPAAPIKWINQTNYNFVEPPERFKGYGYFGSGSTAPALKEFVERITNGRLIIENVPPGGIVAQGETFNAVKAGTIDVSWHTFGASWTGIVPEANMEIGLPYAWQNNREYWDAMEEFGMKEIIQEAYKEHGVWSVTVPGDMEYSWLLTFDAPRLADLKGKKFRAWGMAADWLKAVGATSVSVAGAETYMALKLGTVDAALMDHQYALTERMNEVLTHAIMDPPTVTPVGLAFITSQASVDALPEDLRETLLASFEPFLYYHMNLMKATNDWARNRALQLGAQGDLFEGYLPIYWPEEDKMEAYKIASGLWDEYAKTNARTAKLVELLRTQLREYGRLE